MRERGAQSKQLCEKGDKENFTRVAVAMLSFFFLEIFFF